MSAATTLDVGSEQAPARVTVRDTPSTLPALALADPLKVIAAYMIIWIHTPRSAPGLAATSIARFGVPFFVALSVFFVMQTGLLKSDRTFGIYWRQRVRRIYLPFLAWSLIYLLFKGVKLLVARDQPNDFPGWEWLLLGSAYHLWFLPFVFWLSLFCFGMCQVVRRFPISNSVFIMCWTALALVSVPFAVHVTVPPQYDGLRYMAESIPAALGAIAFSWAYFAGGMRVLRDPRCTAICLAIFLASWMGVVMGGRSVMLECISGVALLGVGVSRVGPGVAEVLRPWAGLSYGIYLIHVLVIKVLETGYSRVGWQPSLWQDVSTFLLTAVGSTLLVWLLLRNARTRWLVS